VRESTFCTEVIRSFRQAGAFAFKIPDSPASYGGAKMRFSAGKRFDIHAVFQGVPLAVECKLYKAFKGFGLNQIRDEQVEALNDYWEAGGRAFVFLNIRIPAIQGRQKRENRCLIFEWPLRFHGKQEIEAYPFIEGRKGVFPLAGWLQGIKEKAA
jgi:hypothetical protein